MIQLIIRKTMAVAAFSFLALHSPAQPAPVPATEKISNKPYKILTSGKQITVKSTKNIKSIMVWTASGHRIVEQKELNAATFSFDVNVKAKVFFVMLQFADGKQYTEKVGVQ